MAEIPTEDDRTRELLDDMENLRHMLGMASNVKPKDYGWRNYYCANVGDASMARLASLHLIRKTHQIGNQEYWSATEAGCRAAGLNEKQMKKALSND